MSARITPEDAQLAGLIDKFGFLARFDHDDEWRVPIDHAEVVVLYRALVSRIDLIAALERVTWFAEEYILRLNAGDGGEVAAARALLTALGGEPRRDRTSTERTMVASELSYWCEG